MFSWAETVAKIFLTGTLTQNLFLKGPGPKMTGPAHVYPPPSPSPHRRYRRLSNISPPPPVTDFRVSHFNTAEIALPAFFQMD
jgi:hypothetical protein